MAMLAAWSILNKVNSRQDKRYSDAVLVVCPNVTIRNRLSELNPKQGEASIYRTCDLVPPHMMSDLQQGRLLTTNWHIMEPRSTQSGGKVVKAGKRMMVRETIYIGDKNTTARGKRYMIEAELRKKVALNHITLISGTESRDKDGNLNKVEIETEKFVESDKALIHRVLGKDLGTRSNILVFNDEAHHAYRLRNARDGDGSGDNQEVETDDLIDEEQATGYYNEATVWVDGLDRVHKFCNINMCVDFFRYALFSRAGRSRYQ